MEDTSLCFSENRSPLSTLLQDKDKMAAWNCFANFNEDDQWSILANNEMLEFFNDKPVLEEVCSSRPGISDAHGYHQLSGEEMFETLCPKLKSIFNKRHFPMVCMHILMIKA